MMNPDIKIHFAWCFSMNLAMSFHIIINDTGQVMVKSVKFSIPKLAFIHSFSNAEVLKMQQTFSELTYFTLKVLMSAMNSSSVYFNLSNTKYSDNPRKIEKIITNALEKEEVSWYHWGIAKKM